MFLISFLVLLLIGSALALLFRDLYVLFLFAVPSSLMLVPDFLNKAGKQAIDSFNNMPLPTPANFLLVLFLVWFVALFAGTVKRLSTPE